MAPALGVVIMGVIEICVGPSDTFAPPFHACKMGQKSQSLATPHGGGHGEAAFSNTASGIQMICPLWMETWPYPAKLHMDLPCDPVILF